MISVGKYIVFEGIDGVGKTTQIRLLKNWLDDIGVPVHLTREPSDAIIGTLARKVLNEHIAVSPQVSALLWASDSLHHQESDNGILTQLRNGVHVLSDRSHLSTYAYLMPECDFEWLNELHKYCRSPDITFFLDMNPRLALSRLHQNRVNLHKHETLSTLQRVREQFEIAINKLSNDWGRVEVIHVIEMSSVLEIQEELRKRLKTSLNLI